MVTLFDDRISSKGRSSKLIGDLSYPENSGEIVEITLFFGPGIFQLQKAWYVGYTRSYIARKA